MDPIDAHDANQSTPLIAGAESSSSKRRQSFHDRWMNAKHHHTAPRNRLLALQGDLPEIPIESQNQSPFDFSHLDNGWISGARSCRPDPDHIVSVEAQRLYRRPRKILVRQKQHLGWNRIRPELVRQVTCVRQARKNIFLRQPRILIEDRGFRLSCGEQFQDELDRKSGSSNDRLSRENIWIDVDSFRPRHDLS